jgi:DNA polymerase-1
VQFDASAWQARARQAKEQAATLAQQLDAQAPVRPGKWEGTPPNWNSPAQVKEVLHLLGFPVERTKDGILAGIEHPLARTLRDYRAAKKQVGTYGAKWLKRVAEDGRIYAKWHQLGTVTGRMSCSGPNLQQLPRDPGARHCFIAPPGRALIKADWSQLHLRLIAHVAPEPAMRAAFQSGQDLHTLTARRITGKEEVGKEDRQTAKVAAFGLCYGMGAETFQRYALSNYGLTLTAAEAKAIRNAFFGAYSGLRSWHHRQGDDTITIRAPSGRSCPDVRRFSDKLSYRILQLEADCLKGALGLLWQRRADIPDTCPVVVCHDEIVLECPAERAEQTETVLVACMLQAAQPWMGQVPAVVTASIGTTWGGGEIRTEKSYQEQPPAPPV